jgi:hypothetical protein
MIKSFLKINKLVYLFAPLQLISNTSKEVGTNNKGKEKQILIERDEKEKKEIEEEIKKIIIEKIYKPKFLSIGIAKGQKEEMIIKLNELIMLKKDKLLLSKETTEKKKKLTIEIAIIEEAIEDIKVRKQIDKIFIAVASGNKNTEEGTKALIMLTEKMLKEKKLASLKGDSDSKKQKEIRAIEIIKEETLFIQQIIEYNKVFIEDKEVNKQIDEIYRALTSGKKYEEMIIKLKELKEITISKEKKLSSFWGGSDGKKQKVILTRAIAIIEKEIIKVQLFIEDNEVNTQINEIFTSLTAKNYDTEIQNKEILKKLIMLKKEKLDSLKDSKDGKKQKVILTRSIVIIEKEILKVQLFIEDKEVRRQIDEIFTVTKELFPSPFTEETAKKHNTEIITKLNELIILKEKDIESLKDIKDGKKQKVILTRAIAIIEKQILAVQQIIENNKVIIEDKEVNKQIDEIVIGLTSGKKYEEMIIKLKKLIILKKEKIDSLKDSQDKKKQKVILTRAIAIIEKQIIEVQIFNEVITQIDEIFTVTTELFPSPCNEETAKKYNTEILTKLKKLTISKEKKLDSLGSDSDGEKQKVILTRAIAIIEKEILEVQQIIENNKVIIEDKEVNKQIDEIFTSLTSENKNTEIITKLNDEMIKKLNEEMIIKLKKLIILKKEKIDSLGSDSDGKKQKVILTRAIAIIEKQILAVQQIIENNKVIIEDNEIIEQINKIFIDLTEKNYDTEIHNTEIIIKLKTETIIKLKDLIMLKKKEIDSLGSDSDGKKQKVILTRAIAIIEKIIIEVQIFNEIITQIDEIYRGLTSENKNEETIIKLKELIVLKKREIDSLRSDPDGEKQKVILTTSMAIIEKEILAVQQTIENNKVIIEDNEIIEQIDEIVIGLTSGKKYEEMIIKLKKLIILKKEKKDSLKDSQDEEKQKVILIRAIAIIEKQILKVQLFIEDNEIIEQIDEIVIGLTSGKKYEEMIIKLKKLIILKKENIDSLGSDADGEKQKVILTRAIAIIEKQILKVQQIIEDNKVRAQIDEIFTVTKKMFPSPLTEETVKKYNTEILTKLKDLIMLKKKEIDSLRSDSDGEKQKVILTRAIAIIEKEILKVQLFIENNKVIIEDKEVNKQIDEILTVTKKMFPYQFTTETVQEYNTEIITKLKDLIMLKKKEIDSLKDSQDEEKQKVILTRAIVIIEKYILNVEQIIENNKVIIEDNEIIEQIYEIFKDLTSENKNEEIIIKLKELKEITISKKEKIDSLKNSQDEEKQKVILTRAIAIIEKLILEAQQIIEDNIIEDNEVSIEDKEVRAQIYEIFTVTKEKFLFPLTEETAKNYNTEILTKLKDLIMLKKENIDSLGSDSDGEKQKVILTRAIAIIEKLILEVQQIIEDKEVNKQIDEIVIGLTLGKKYEEMIIKLKKLIILKKEKIDSLKDSQDEEKQKVILTRAIAIIEKQILSVQQIIEDNK